MNKAVASTVCPSPCTPLCLRVSSLYHTGLHIYEQAPSNDIARPLSSLSGWHPKERIPWEGIVEGSIDVAILGRQNVKQHWTQLVSTLSYLKRQKRHLQTMRTGAVRRSTQHFHATIISLKYNDRLLANRQHQVEQTDHKFCRNHHILSCSETLLLRSCCP